MPNATHLSLDHASNAEDYLDSLSGQALPPALLIEVAQTHALLAIADAIEQLNEQLAGDPAPLRGLRRP